MDEMNIPPAQFQWVRNISLIFVNQSWKCPRCHQIDAGSDDFPMDDTKAPYPHYQQS
jgi:hypothetical protein